MEAYKSALASVGDDFYNMNAPCWASLVSLITEEVLEDAHTSSNQYLDLFHSVGLKPTSRPMKRMARILVKASGTRPDVPFKVNSDLCAFQFKTETVVDISNIMKVIHDTVKKNNGMFFIRNSIQDPITNDYTDIIQYAFVYIPKIGYIAEIQVGHPFVMYTFSRDSLLRDLRLAGQCTKGIVDLWDNDFYDAVKQYILGKSSKTEDEIIKMWPGGTDVHMDNILKCILAKVFA